VFAQCNAQNAPAIKLKKEHSSLVFFQSGNKKDTISKGSGDLFYLAVPDTMKDDIVIYVDNGRIETTRNDSLVRLSYLPGISYESVYVHENKLTRGTGQFMSRRTYSLKTLINGATSLEKNHIRVRIADRMQGDLIRNSFIYLPVSTGSLSR